MCYAVLVIVGEYNFNRLISNLVDFIRHTEREMEERTHLAKKTTEVFVDQLRQSVTPLFAGSAIQLAALVCQGDKPLLRARCPIRLSLSTEGAP
jgi:hypothetical protein